MTMRSGKTTPLDGSGGWVGSTRLPAATRGRDSDDQRRYLHDLPLTANVDRDDVRFHMVHAIPSDPLYGRLGRDAREWEEEVFGLDADVLIVGLLALAGFLLGGVISFWSRNKVAAVVCAVLALLALGGAVLRLLPA